MNGFFMHKIYLRQALITCSGFSRVLRHSNSNNTFISIVFVFWGGHLVYTITLLIMEAHNTIIYPVCIMFFYKKLSKATYLVSR